jgi:anaerobic ribonucleoside-triphosphate reductase activating protein
MCPDKDVWIYTGYRYEQVADAEILKWADVLVDGPFVEAEKDISLAFRGSRTSGSST